MKKYICDKKLTATGRYDVIVVGSGVAGLYTALNLDPSLRCLILSKDKSETCNSWYAQGGVAAVTLSDDDAEMHVKDTLVAGAGLCKEDAVRVLVTQGPKEIQQLLKWGVAFDVNQDGQLQVTREGGHSMRRILHCGGDATGKELTKHLAYLASQRENITIVSNVFLTDIIAEDDRAVGVIVKREEYELYLAPNIVICTGGIGQVYEHTTNPSEATGDGMAAAKRAGAALKDMEFVQFHPTAYAKHIKHADGRHFLISEAVRGEGAYLRNDLGERFMLDKHPLKELAPRDIVARCIYREMEKRQIDCVYLDITHRSREFLQERFPTIYNSCLESGLDIAKDMIPVVPVHHYMMGGVETDLNAMTNIDGLYACGEVACTGVHGANRLASNSLLECLVYGQRSAAHIMAAGRKLMEYEYIPPVKEDATYRELDYAQVKQEIKRIMTKFGGIIRAEKQLEKGLFRMQSIREMLEESELREDIAIEALNMSTVAEDILFGAMKRKESVGAHYCENEGGDV